jgi:hypothetical protein
MAAIWQEHKPKNYHKVVTVPKVTNRHQKFFIFSGKEA